MAKSSESEKLGKILEEATKKIFEEIFHEWGYNSVLTKQQKSGTQHGFDVFFQIDKPFSTLNIFVECKNSKKYNKIELYELSEKIRQLDWAGFPVKDVHIFFSPTREINFDNQTLSIEDDSFPFTIVDWMRKEDKPNLAMELFFAYTGDNKEILEYRDFLRKIIDKTFTASRTFSEVCRELKQNFDGRIEKHFSPERFKNFRIISSSFWHQAIEKTDFDFVHYFYTKADSTEVRLIDVVANNLYVKNEKLDKRFAKALSRIETEKFSLIKILSRGGEGKSTFLYHIARNYYQDNTIVFLESVDVGILAEIQNQLKFLPAEKPIVFLIDNAAVFGQDLLQFATKLSTVFRQRKIAFVLAERDFRYQNIEDIETFESQFNEAHTLYLSSKDIKEQIFERFFSYLQLKYSVLEDSRTEAKEIFLRDERKSLSESTLAVIKQLKYEDKLKGYKFDWEDWNEVTGKKAPELGLGRLYLILSTFYQFGFSLDIRFAASFLKNADEIDIRKFLQKNANLPISLRGNRLFLRHETIASWYLESHFNRQDSEDIFKQFLEKIDTDSARDLFIWLCIKNKDFRKSYLSPVVSNEKKIEILTNFIQNHQKELKFRTELSKIYQQQGKWTEAEDVLLELLKLDENNLQGRTELSKIYQQQGKWREAEDILLESLKIDNEQLHPRTELSKIYQRQGKWTEAEDVLLELLQLDENNLQGRTELSKIYQRQGKWTEAEDVLLELLKLDENNLQGRTELSKIYQRQGKWREAEDVLLELLQLDENNLQGRTELSKIYQRQGKWTEAEEQLRKCIEINPNDLSSRTELSKIYQRQGKWKEAEEQIQKCREIEPTDVNSLLELSRICQKNPERRSEAKQYLERILEIEPENKYALLELSRVYEKLRNYPERESLLFRIYDIEPQDIPTLNQLSSVFARFKKYRISIRLLEKSLEIRPNDIRTILILIERFKILNDAGNLEKYVEKCNQILAADKHAKYSELFYKLDSSVNEEIELTELNKIGTLTTMNGKRYVEGEDDLYRVGESATYNYNINKNDKVFFAIYKTKDGRIFADFIEPYFEDITDLQSLR